MALKKNSKFQNLIGRWQTEDEDSRLILEISEKRGKPHVSAFDKIDGEKFKIRKLCFEKGKLTFELFVSSSGYRTLNRLSFSSKNVLNQKITLFEKWTRIT